MNIGTLTVILTANTVGLTRATRAMQNLERVTAGATAGAAASIAKTEAAVVNLGRSLTQFVTVPMAILGAVSLKTFADFEYNLAKIEGLVGVAESQTKAWVKSILDLSIAVGKGPVELADALYFITSSGFKGAEAMEILNITSKAAAAGLGEVKYVADVVTSAMNAYRGTNLTAAKATDILVTTIREGKGEVDKMVASMGVALPIASKLGVGMDQVGAAMASMTRVGTTVATSAVQTRQMFNSLLKPAKQSRDAIKEMGSSYEELRNILKSQGLTAMLQKVQDLTGGNTAAMARLFPNIRALNGIIELTGENFETFKKVQEEITNSTGATEEAFRVMQKTLKMALNIEVARLQVLMIKLGNLLKEIVLPVLRGLVNVLEWVAKGFGKLPLGLQTFIAILGGLLMMLGPTIIAVKGLGAAFIYLKGAVASLGKVIVAHPYLAAAAAIITIVAALGSWYVATKKQTEAQKKLNAEVDKKYAIQQLPEGKQILNEMGLLGVGGKNFDYDYRIYTETAEKSALAALKGMSSNKIAAARMTILDEMVDFRKQIENATSPNATVAQLVIGADAQGTLDMYKRLLPVMDAYIKADEEYRKTLMLDEEAIEEVNKSLDKYNEALNSIVQKQKMFGKTYDASSDLVSAYKSRLDDLAEVSKIVTPEMQKLADAIWSIESAMKMTTMAPKGWQEAISKIFDKTPNNLQKAIMDSNKGSAFEFDEQGKIKNLFGLTGTYKMEAEKIFDINKAIGKSIQDVFQGMQNVITDALNSTENVFKAFGKFFGDFIKGMIFKLVAATIAALALVVAISLIPGMGGLTKGFGSIQKALDTGNFGKALLGGLGVLSGGASLASGGIVPDGYSNDTYRANLSSQEAVIPLERLPQLMGIGASGGGKQVEFIIEGRVLKGILADANMMGGIM